MQIALLRAHTRLKQFMFFSEKSRHLSGRREKKGRDARRRGLVTINHRRWMLYYVGRYYIESSTVPDVALLMRWITIEDLQSLLAYVMHFLRLRDE